jgi:hypothetical protein
MFIDYNEYNNSVIDNYRQIFNDYDIYGLISYYKFDNNYEDSYGNNHLINTGTPQFNFNNKIINQSIFFNNYQYLTSSEIINTTNSMSFSFWFKKKNINDTGILFGINNNFFFMSNGNNEFYLSNRHGNNLEEEEYLLIDFQLNQDEWYHCVLIIKNIPGEYNIYINSVKLKYTIHKNSNPILNPIGYLHIGSGFSIITNDFSDNYIGYIDEFRVYNKILTINDIRKIYTECFVIKNDIDIFYKYIQFKNINSEKTLYKIKFLEETQCHLLLIDDNYYQNFTFQTLNNEYIIEIESLQTSIKNDNIYLTSTSSNLLPYNTNITGTNTSYNQKQLIIKYEITTTEPIIKVFDTNIIQLNHFNQLNFNLTNSHTIQLEYFKVNSNFFYNDNKGYNLNSDIRNLIIDSFNISNNTVYSNLESLDHSYKTNKINIHVNIPAIGYLINSNIEPEPFFITDIESSVERIYPSTHARQKYFDIHYDDEYNLINEYTVQDSFYDNGTYIINYSSYFNEDLSPINLFYKPNPETYESHEAIWAENNYQNGIYIGNNNLGGINGDWITIQMPNKILLTKYLFVTYSYLTLDESKSKLPKKYSIFGCNNNDNNWEKIYDDNIPDISNINKNYTYYDYENTNTEYTEDNIAYEVILNSSNRLTGNKLFNTFALIVNQTFNSTQLAMAEWELYGKVPSVFYQENFYLYKNLHIKQDLIALSTHSSPSDKKLKTNITFLSNCNQLINKLNPISFQWKNDTNFISPKYYNKNDVGFLAQEVQQILPIIVKDSYYKNISYKKLNETKIIAYLINVIKNIHNRIEILEKNI